MKDFFDFLGKWGVKGWLISDAMLTVYGIIGIAAIYRAIKFLLNSFHERYLTRLTNQDLHPFFTPNEVIKYTKYYVPQYYQNITPSEGDEIGLIYAAAAKSKLMGVFLKDVLLEQSSKKYFIILSDTGMGKTAFMINLFIRYNSMKPKVNQIKYEIRYIPLGFKDALELIKNIPNKLNTILLLDAFDEDIKAVHDYQGRMIEILNQVKEFRKVVFTCRTQFFPSKDEEPKDTNDITFGENLKHSLKKLYLSAFDDKDVTRYLFKKYGLNILKFLKASKVVKKSPLLMFRPMLLSYIDDLLSTQDEYKFPFQIYKVLIAKWVVRESRKPAILSRNYHRDYSEILMIFSHDLAKNLYNNRDKRQGYFVTIDDLKQITSAQTIDMAGLSIGDKTGRSLLNRNSIGQFKFAHKSILEYFLALHLISDPKFLELFDFHGMDATASFYNEMLTNLLNKLTGTAILRKPIGIDGISPQLRTIKLNITDTQFKTTIITDNLFKTTTRIEGAHSLFEIKNNEALKKLSLIIPSDIKYLHMIVIKKASELKNAEHFAGFKDVNTIIFTDSDFLGLYLVYLYMCLDPIYADTYVDDVSKENFNFFMDNYVSEISQLRRMIPQLNDERISIVINNCDLDKNLKNAILAYLAGTYATPNEKYFELIKIKSQIMKGRSERAVIINGFEHITKVFKVSTHLPKVKVIF